MKKKSNGSRLRPLALKYRTPQQIAKAGMTLSAGFIALPFIPFNKAKTYSIKLKKKYSKGGKK